MTTFSYPFQNDKEWDNFWKCFSDIETTEVLNIESKFLINNKFCKGKVYYISGVFSKKWKSLKPDKNRYTFQIGEQENCHGHFINCDMTEFFARQKLCPWQHSVYWAAPSCMDVDRTKTVHTPRIAHDRNEDCWDVLWGMIKGLRQYDGKSLSSMEMDKHWDVEKMHWIGPFAIGHLRGLSEFQEYHQSRFLDFIPDRDGSKGINKVIFPDGNYAGLMGHPSMTCTHKGEYFGFKPEGGNPRLFVMDFWTCDGEKLLDNWCQIDMIDLFRSINKEYESFIDEALYYNR